MSRALALQLSLVGFAIFSTAAWTGSVPAGPPWISLEIPANPLDPTTRGAALAIHTFHHERPVGFPVTGTAEGLVNGQRRTIELEFTETSRPGVYALKQQWPTEGDWLLAISTTGAADASLMVELGSNGGVRTERYYSMAVNVVSVRSASVVEGRLNAQHINTALQKLAARTD